VFLSDGSGPVFGGTIGLEEGESGKVAGTGVLGGAGGRSNNSEGKREGGKRKA